MASEVVNVLVMRGPEAEIARLLEVAVKRVEPQPFCDHEGNPLFAVPNSTYCVCRKGSRFVYSTKPFAGLDFDGDVSLLRPIIKPERVEENLDFNYFIPVPAATLAAGLSAAWKWQDLNWGTWEPSEGSVRKLESGGVAISFVTSFEPPVPVIRELARQFPDLSGEHCFITEGCEKWGSREIGSGHLFNFMERSAEMFQPCEEDRFGDVTLRHSFERAHGSVEGLDALAKTEMERGGRLAPEQIQAKLNSYRARVESIGV